MTNNGSPLSRGLVIAQLNPIVGDLAGNAEKVLRAYHDAMGQGAQIVVCPELCLVGYPPEDLVLMPSVAKEATKIARDIAAQTGETGLVFGTVWAEAGALYNAAIFASDGRIQHIAFKNKLPNYGVFDEKRIFTPGGNPKVFEWRGQRLAVVICEDVWFLELAQQLERQQVEQIIAINASPFERGKLANRKQVVARFAQTAKAPVVYVNLVGGQDDLVFDGASFVVDAAGYVTFEAPGFEEGIFVHREPCIVDGKENIHDARSTNHDIWSAMQLGLADYVLKNGFSKVLLGLSGGIDSALSAVCAVDALGADNVHGVLLPSPYTSQASIDDALLLAKNLGITTDTIPIIPIMEAAQQALDSIFSRITNHESRITPWIEDPVIGGNLQARIRGQILMALSNKTSALLLSTGNKSEIAVGYTTLYGDACGGYNVLKDVYKTSVYELAKWLNTQGAVIPQNSITRAPSAELAPNQKDSDQLPEYEVLDAILEQHIEGRKSVEEIVTLGFDVNVVKRVLHLVRISEYKRRQSCPGVKISSMMFGRDRRYPLTLK